MGWAPSSDWCPERNLNTDTGAGRTPCDNRGRDCTEAAAGQGTPRTDGPDARKGQRGILPGSQREPSRQLEFRLPAFRTGRRYVPVVPRGVEPPGLITAAPGNQTSPKSVFCSRLDFSNKLHTCTSYSLPSGEGCQHPPGVSGPNLGGGLPALPPSASHPIN